METLMTKLQTFCKAQPVLLIAFFAAILTMLFVPPDRGYLSYCNRTVLIQLFCLMMAVAGFRSIGVFETVTDLLLKRAGTLRKLGMILTLLCFFVSMLVTNDVALLTLIPLTLLVYDQISDEKSRILTIVLETAAANLGSMVTPFGNPQNLYLFDFYHLTLQEFFCTMLPAGMVSLVCLVMLGFLLPSTPCNARPSEKKVIPKLHFTGYGVLFLLCLLTVFRVIPDWCCLIAAVMVPLALNKSLFRKVDYALLATFVCFFVFVGNIARMETVSNFLSDILAGRELLISALLSQECSCSCHAFRLYRARDGTASGRQSWGTGKHHCLTGQPDLVSILQIICKRSTKEIPVCLFCRQLRPACIAFAACTAGNLIHIIRIPQTSMDKLAA